jgi:hypothetical protein
MTMQMTQDTNWVQRVDSDARARTSTDEAMVVIFVPPLAMAFHYRRVPAGCAQALARPRGLGEMIH